MAAQGGERRQRQHQHQHHRAPPRDAAAQQSPQPVSGRGSRSSRDGTINSVFACTKSHPRLPSRISLSLACLRIASKGQQFARNLEGGDANEDLCALQ